MTDEKIKRGAAEAELIQKKRPELSHEGACELEEAGAQSSATKELANLKKQAHTLKSACDSLVKNFDSDHQVGT